jgi:hypothetical protein
MNRTLFTASLLVLAAIGGSAAAQGDNGGYNWTGFYLGVNLGGAFLTSCPRFDVQGPVTGTVYTGANCPKPSSFIGGGQFGFNYQFGGNWVFGMRVTSAERPAAAAAEATP